MGWGEFLLGFRVREGFVPVKFIADFLIQEIIESYDLLKFLFKKENYKEV
jgi:hypothetical protein